MLKNFIFVGFAFFVDTKYHHQCHNNNNDDNNCVYITHDVVIITNSSPCPTLSPWTTGLPLEQWIQLICNVQVQILKQFVHDNTPIW